MMYANKLTMTPLLKQYIFVWRLTYEKWFDLILNLCKKIAREKETYPIHVHIFWNGPYKEELEEYLSNRSFVTYYGHTPKEKVKKIWRTCQWTLMPSRFLETFWLTALDSLALWVPVLWRKAGWLEQFLDDGSTDVLTKDVFFSQFEATLDISNEAWLAISKKSQFKAFSYTKDKRLERFMRVSWLLPGAKILLISDYTVDVGGIESYVHSVQDLLSEAWYTVKFIWCDDVKKANNRFLQLFSTIWNTQADKLLRTTLETYTPDLIWWHSVQRWLGPLPLRSVRTHRARQWIMYHDFWLFHPYPSLVYSQEQVSRATTFLWYMKESFRWPLWKVPLCVAKRCSSLLIVSFATRSIDLHLVPSTYMENLLIPHLSTKKNITTLPHFL